MKDKRKRPPFEKPSKPKKNLRQPSPDKIAKWINEIAHYPLLRGSSRQFNVRIPWGLYRMMELEALNQGLSLSDFVRSCLTFHTVPRQLLETVKENPQTKLNPQQGKILEEYQTQLRKFGDDLRYVKRVLELKGKMAMEGYLKALEKQKGKKSK